MLLEFSKNTPALTNIFESEHIAYLMDARVDRRKSPKLNGQRSRKDLLRRIVAMRDAKDIAIKRHILTAFYLPNITAGDSSPA